MTTRPVHADSKLSVTVPDEHFMELWQAAPAPAELRLWDLTQEPPVEPTLVVTPYAETESTLVWLKELPTLEVVQTLAAGVDLVSPFVPEGVTLCNAAGVHDAGTAELAVGLALTTLRGIGLFTRSDISHGAWPPAFRPSLADRKALIIGSGRIGNALAARLRAFEVSVSRVASRRRNDEDGVVYPASDLPYLLPQHDTVFLTLPLNSHTFRIVDKEFLALMPDGALLVNVGRGVLVDTDALVKELSSGRLLAGLDVTDPEPLPYDHPLWDIPGVVITPHAGGASTAFVPRARALICDQIERLAKGAPLQNVISGPPARQRKWCIE